MFIASMQKQNIFSMETCLFHSNLTINCFRSGVDRSPHLSIIYPALATKRVMNIHVASARLLNLSRARQMQKRALASRPPLQHAAGTRARVERAQSRNFTSTRVDDQATAGARGDARIGEFVFRDSTQRRQERESGNSRGRARKWPAVRRPMPGDVPRFARCNDGLRGRMRPAARRPPIATRPSVERRGQSGVGRSVAKITFSRRRRTCGGQRRLHSGHFPETKPRKSEPDRRRRPLELSVPSGSVDHRRRPVDVYLRLCTFPSSSVGFALSRPEVLRRISHLAPVSRDAVRT